MFQNSSLDCERLQMEHFANYESVVLRIGKAVRAFKRLSFISTAELRIDYCLAPRQYLKARGYESRQHHDYDSIQVCPHR